MSHDPQATAEARALLACIRVTRDAAEQNRLWNRYYRLSDEVFPEAAALRRRYKGMQGEERQRFKVEYMELVRRLWRATDPTAAYDGPLSEEPPAAPVPGPAPARKSPDAAHRPAPARRRSGARWVWAFGGLLALVGAGVVIWQNALDHAATPDQETRSEFPLFLPEPGQPAPPPASRGTKPERRSPITPMLPRREAAPDVAAVDPLPMLEVPMEEIEKELAEEIKPVFSPVPPELKGKGDRVEAEGTVYEDVYVIETDSLYYLRIPETGGVASVGHDATAVHLGEDSVAREDLLALWRKNREAIADAEERREKEKKIRIAARKEAQEKALAQRKAAQDAAYERAKEKDWLALAPAQRHSARLQAYSDWRRIQADAEKLRQLYTNIARTYEYIGVNDSRMADINKTYRQLAREFGPNYDVEDAFMIYGWGREEIMRQLAEWESEYYRMLDYVNERYPTYEARVQEIERLDATLPEKVRVAEETGNWEGSPDGTPSIGVSFGTGFIVAPGYVMTCAHVVRDGRSIKVTSTSGKTYEAKVLTTDGENDWCVLEVKGLTGNPIPMAPGTPNVGATIYCLGYPLGGIRDSNDPIVGSGNVAALQRIDGDNRFIQITAPINPGNSGGPVLDQQGRWVGIVSQKLSDLQSLQTSQTVAQGLNYAVKASVVEPMVRKFSSVQLSRGGGASVVSLEQITKTVSPSIVKIEVD